MFKNLREKISSSDSNSRKSQSPISDDNKSDESIDGQKQPGLQNRFSSLSSLVSDVSSAFSKAMTAPQHVQPVNKPLITIHDSDSISEYDESLIGIDVINKEELFQRYQRIRSIAKRYKTRYLETIEINRKLESDKEKFSKTLTETQDKQFRRITEFKEQIELDRRAKQDIEENYMLLIEEKVELINVLKLQVNLLKEGKDLPPELEAQIRERHEKAVEVEKKQFDEIKELKATLIQRENLLQRCKEKLSSMNSQLNEIKMKYDNLKDSSVDSDKLLERFNADLAKQRFQQVEALENIQKEHSDRIRTMLSEFENQKEQLEKEMNTDFDRKSNLFKNEIQQFKTLIGSLTQDNEKLTEQLNIKTKIVEDLLNNQQQEQQNNIVDENCQEKFISLQNVFEKFQNESHPIIDEMRIVFADSQNITNTQITKHISLVDDSESNYHIESKEFTEDYIIPEDPNENNTLLNLQDEKKFLIGKLETLERLKSFSEEEASNISAELEGVQACLKSEREKFINERNSLLLKISDLEDKLNSSLQKGENLETRLNEMKILLNQKDIELKSLEEENSSFVIKINEIENSSKNMEDETSVLRKNVEKLVEENRHLYKDVETMQNDYFKCQNALTLQKDECKVLKDKVDELMFSIDSLTAEKCSLLKSNEQLEIEHVSNDSSIHIQEELSKKILYLTGISEEKCKEVDLLSKTVNDNVLLVESLNMEINRLKLIESEFITNETELADLRKLKEENERIKSNLDLIQSRQQLEYEELKMSNDNLVKELNEINHKNLNLINELANITQDYEESQRKFNELELTVSKNGTLKELIERLENENKCLAADLSDLRKNFNEEKLNNNKLLEDIGSLTQNMEDIKIQLDNVITIKNNLESQLETLARDSEMLKIKNNTLSSYAGDKDNELTDLSSKADIFMNQCKEKDGTIQNLEDEKRELQNGLKELERQIHCLLTEKKDAASFADNKIEELQSDVAGQKEVADSLQVDVSRLKEKVNETESLYSALQAENAKLKKDLLQISTGDEEFSKKFMEKELECCEIQEMVRTDRLQLERNFEKMIEFIEHCLGTLSVSAENVNKELFSDYPDSNKFYHHKSIDTMWKSIKKLSSALDKLNEGLLKSKTDLEKNEELLKEIRQLSDNNESILDRLGTFLVENKKWNLEDCEESKFGKFGKLESSVKLILDDLNQKTDELIEIRSSCQAIMGLFDANDNIPDCKVAFSALLEPIFEKIKIFIVTRASEISSRDKTIENLQSIKESLEERLEKSHSSSISLFKQLISIFHLTNIELDNKLLRKLVVRALKEYVKIRNSLEEEVCQLKNQLGSKELELEQSLTDNRSTQAELDGLRESLESDRNRLNVTRQELESSLRRLNEVADEKGRIDEEKQTLRKELKELNEKISLLKVEFERQSKEKERLEIQFDESLEKVKLNHNALEETYKKELEKQHGYQRQLEEQIVTQREAVSRQLTETEHKANEKLEHVLNQSEELLSLNHQYKTLLDQTKLEAQNVTVSLRKLEADHNNVIREILDVKNENKTLTENLLNIRNLLDETSLERDDFKIKIRKLEHENNNSSESLTSLQKACDNKNSEYENLTSDVKLLKDELTQHREEIIRLQAENRTYMEKLSVAVLENTEFNGKVKDLQEQVGTKNVELDRLIIEKNRLMGELKKHQKANETARIETDESKILASRYKEQVEALETELAELRISFEAERNEMERHFNDAKSLMEEDHNCRVKKLVKEFNEKMSQKEVEFQKTFEEALGNVRNEDLRLKCDLKSEVDELTRTVIDLELEKNKFLDIISDCEVQIKELTTIDTKTKSTIQIIEKELEEKVQKILELEIELDQARTTEKEYSDKLKQTIDSSTCYEYSVDEVIYRDQEVLLMHCKDVEEQLKQLQIENNHLKQIANHETSSIVSQSFISKDAEIVPTKCKQLTCQTSFSNEVNRTPSLHHTGSFRSPNASCSEYQFCPYPITDSTDYEYLKQILFKYMTGMETETLSKVVGTVMRFSIDELNHVLSYEQDRKKCIRILP